MKALLVMLFASILPGLIRAGESELPPPPSGLHWNLVWNDEFNGNTIDPEKWERPDVPRRGHWWRPESAFLDGQGHLVMRTGKVGERFASPCLRTAGRFTKTFGYFVARCRLPREQGHWSAFWLYHPAVGSTAEAGRDGTEIDIMEWPWRDGRVQHTLHWDGYGKAHKSKGLVSRPKNILDGQFHTFALWWQQDVYVFYVDGVETWRTDAGGVCRVPLYIKLSEEIGTWAGDIKKARLPDDFVVDYVRVYDLERDKGS